MMEAIGWAATAGSGAYIAFSVCALLAGISGGGLEAIPRMIVAGWLGAAAWIAFVLWLSPYSIVILP